MSIYIKGMEMPRSCFYCPFQHKNTTECLITHKYYNWGLTTPPSDCPLIHVPPHGRLIDADALISRCQDEKGNYYGHDSAVIGEALESAPTVIEAEAAE